MGLVQTTAHAKRGINSEHVPRYLGEFECRFNRRYDLAAMQSTTPACLGAVTPPVGSSKVAGGSG